jgi:hypothetical protein
MNHTQLLSIQNPSLLAMLTPKTRTYTFSVRFANDSFATFDMTIRPRRGENYNDAINCLREKLKYEKKYRGTNAVVIQCINTLESR